jgi:Tol biopolymer transport system component
MRAHVLALILACVLVTGCGIPPEATTAMPSPALPIAAAEAPSVTITAVPPSPVPATPTAMAQTPPPEDVDGGPANEIAYVLDQAIMLLDLASGVSRQLSPMGLAPRELAWAPSGDHLAFSAGTEQTDIYTLELETGEVTQITDTPDIEIFPAYAPNGTLYFVRRVLESDYPTIAIVRHDADGTEMVVYEESTGLCGPSGLVFGSEQRFAFGLNCGRGSYVMLGDLQSDQMSSLAETYFGSEPLCAYEVAWPVDEQRLLVMTSRECAPWENGQIVLVDLNNPDEPPRVLYDASRIGTIAWSADHDLVLWSQRDAGGVRSDLWLLEAGLDEPRPLGPGENPAFRPRLP